MKEQEFMNDVTSALREVNIDPDKICVVPLFPSMLKEYVRGAWTRNQFQDNCKKICIFNGSKLDDQLVQ